MSSTVSPPDLESEARAATDPGRRVGLIVRLLATGEWVHGVTAYSLAGLWGIEPADALAYFDEAIGQFAAVPGSHDALRGLGFARLNHLADRAMAHKKKAIAVGDDGEVHVREYDDPQYRDAIRATEAAYALALGGDPDGAADEAELDRLLAQLDESQRRLE